MSIFLLIKEDYGIYNIYKSLFIFDFQKLHDTVKEKNTNNRTIETVYNKMIIMYYNIKLWPSGFL